MRTLRSVLFALALGALSGCGSKSDKEPVQLSTTPQKPEKAASQLQEVFVAAEPEVKTVANVASEALKSADYEAAIHSLQTIKERGQLTVEQGIAVQNSMVSLEAKLIAAMNAGDANAKRAYEQLKRSRKN